LLLLVLDRTVCKFRFKTNKGSRQVPRAVSPQPLGAPNEGEEFKQKHPNPTRSRLTSSNGKSSPSDVRGAASPRPHHYYYSPHPSNAHQLESNHPHAFARSNWIRPCEPGPTCHLSRSLRLGCEGGRRPRSFYRSHRKQGRAGQGALTPRRR
jgi:hypothetical protein